MFQAFLCRNTMILELLLKICIVLVAVDMVDDFPHIVIGGSFGLEYRTVLVSNVTDAAVNGAAVEGDLVACGIFQNDVGPHGDVNVSKEKTK